MILYGCQIEFHGPNTYPAPAPIKHTYIYCQLRKDVFRISREKGGETKSLEFHGPNYISILLSNSNKAYLHLLSASERRFYDYPRKRWRNQMARISWAKLLLSNSEPIKHTYIYAQLRKGVLGLSEKTMARHGETEWLKFHRRNYFSILLSNSEPIKHTYIYC